MGNKMSCFCHREEDHPAEEIQIQREEEIPMQVLDESEIPEESNHDRSDSPDYVEMRELSPPKYVSLIDLADSPNEEAHETFRLRVMAEHFYPTKLEQRHFFDTTVPMSPELSSENMECLYHISMYNSQRKRIMDLTYINDLTSNSLSEHIMYWKNSEEDSWTLNYSTDDSPMSFKQCRISPVRKVFLWATTVHVKNDTGLYKMLFLSRKPATIVVPSHIKRSAGCVVYLTAFNAQLRKTLDLVLIYGNDERANSECYVQFRDPVTDRVCQFSIDAPDDFSQFRNYFG